MTSPQPQLRGHGSEPHCDPEHGCITCGDVAVAMRVLRIDHERELALGADESGERHTIEVALVQPVEPGDELLVHAGTAIARLESERPAGDPAGADAEAQAKGPSRRRGQGVSAGAEQPAGDPAGADAEAQAKGPSRRRGQGMFAGAEQPAGVAP